MDEATIVIDGPVQISLRTIAADYLGNSPHTIHKLFIELDLYGVRGTETDYVASTDTDCITLKRCHSPMHAEHILSQTPIADL